MKRNVWENNQRHYCSVCNAWMGSDRQSILIHENGKKHRENVEASLKKQRDEKLKQEKARNLIASTLQQMNEAVAAPDGLIPSSTASFQPLTFNHKKTSEKPGHMQNKKEAQKKDSYNRMKKETKSEEADVSFQIQEPKAGTSSSNMDIISRKRKLMHDEGYYILGDETYLCGHVFCEIFEVDMVVEIFTGSLTMTKEYQRSLDALPLWKTGVILTVHGNKTNTNQEPCSLLFDVSYLKNIHDEDETIEKRVNPDRLRIRMGIDDLAPKTLEEAELALFGGEAIVTFEDPSDNEIDENTGLSKWGTVSVRKVTISHELKEERKRQKVQIQDELDRQLHQSKELERRQKDETQQMHAQDSALGAYDVFNTMKGYKGVSIHDNVSQAPQGLPVLHTGPVSITFKAKGGQGLNKKKLRQTKADDSDDD